MSNEQGEQETEKGSQYNVIHAAERNTPSTESMRTKNPVPPRGSEEESQGEHSLNKA